MSYLYSESGRDYYVCEECKKPYLFKTGKVTSYGMRNYCRACRPAAYPMLPKKVKVNA